MSNSVSARPCAGPQSPIVDAAVSTVRAFGDSVDRDTAAILLSMWSRRGELSPADRLAVLDVFGPPPAFPAHDGYRVGGGSR